jgi:Ca-activated chloride channel family protein
VVVWGILVWLAGGRVALAQPATLQFAEKPVMVNCDLANSPCFRLKFNVVDEKGAPAPVELPAPDQLVRSLTIHMGDRTATPFFALADSDGQRGQVRPRIALILIDVSGSMNTRLRSGQTRFEAAKAGATIFLNGFEDGTDRLAVAPFGSQHVEQTIRAARFATTKEQARAEILDLPRPEPKTNTALFSAVSAALDVVATAARDVPGSPEAMLLVMTDGQNDVQPGDDLGLLAGSEGLQAVERKVQSSGVPVDAIGFGSKDEIDETALRRISTKYNMTEDPEDLKRLFTVARALLNSRMRVTLESPWGDRASLAGRSFPFRADLRLPGGEILHSDVATWSPPQMGVPVFQGKCSEAEARALLIRPKLPDTTGWLGVAILRPLLVFLGLGMVLAVLWFGLPRLIWPARYEQEAEALRPDRWVDQSRVEPGASVRKAPPGFDKHNQGAPERAPSDKTTVKPRDDFHTTRTRLD